MAEPAAKQGDIIKSDGTSQVWVQSESSPKLVPFTYAGPIKDQPSSNVRIMGKSAATKGSTATKLPSLKEQFPSVLSKVDDTGTIITGSSSVFINGKQAARNGDKANTWDYSEGLSPGKPNEKPNAKVEASGSVFIGD